MEMTPDRATLASATKKRKATESKNGIESDEENIASKESKTTQDAAAKPRQRKRATSVKASRPIGRDYNECEHCDKKLIDMHNAEKTWPDIREEWEKLTGEKTAPSTLPNRYARLMNNFTIIPDDDKAILIAVRQEVEKAFEREKWSKVAAEMQKKGTALYTPVVLERQHKKMMLDAEHLPPIKKIAKTASKAASQPDDWSILIDNGIISDDEE